MSKRLRSLLPIFLLSSALMLTFELDAYEPSVTLGKPSLQDILYSPDGRFLATLTRSYVVIADCRHGKASESRGLIPKICARMVKQAQGDGSWQEIR